MKKRVLISCVLLSLVMMLSCVMAIGASAATTVSMTEVAAGTAIGDKEVTISSADELYALASYVANGGVTEGKTFRLTADIALPAVSGATVVSKKQNSNAPDIGSEAKPFKGIFLGGDHTISNLIIAKNARVGGAATENRGIFAYTDGATVSALHVAVASVSYANTNVGGLIGYAKNTTVSLCTAEGSLTNNADNRVQKNVGGLIGTADGCTIAYVKSSATVSGLENVGGVVGLAKNATNVTYAYSEAKVGSDKGEGGANFGGIVGKLEGSAVETGLLFGGKVSDAGATAQGAVAGSMDATSTITNVLIDITSTAVVGESSIGARLAQIYAKTALTGAVAFDANYKLANTVTVAGVAADNALSAINLHIQSASYSEKLYFARGTTGYEFVSCTAHTRPADSFACEDVLCVNCSIPMAATAQHTRPADAKACATGVKCEICNKVEVAGVAHTIPENTPACKEGVVCSVCEENIEPTKSHRVLGVTSCTNIAKCEDCGKMMAETTTPHDWDGNQTCATDETCKVCKQVNPEKLRTGNHIKNIPEPTCTEAVKCTVCTKILTGEDGKLLKALGHDESGAEPNCGYAKVCAREGCNHVLEDATGAHTIDWASATVHREPSPEMPGHLEGTCSVCGKTQESYPKYEAPDDGNTGADPEPGEPGEGNSGAGDGKVEEPSDGLPLGALIGIIAGAVVVVGGGAAAAIVLAKKKKKD